MTLKLRIKVFNKNFINTPTSLFNKYFIHHFQKNLIQKLEIKEQKIFSFFFSFVSIPFIFSVIPKKIY